MHTKPATVIQASVRFGVIGGGAAVLFSLVGMVEVFGQRTIIGGVVSMGQAFLAVTMLLSAFAAARPFSTVSPRAMLAAGALTGAIVGAMLAALVLLGTSINIRDVFVSASPPLFELLSFGQVQFYMGFVPGIKAFTAAVLGGIGNVPGAMVGGLFLGVFESVGPSLFLDGLGIPAPNQLKDAIAFTMLVFVLIFRPSGILGERLATKKA